MGDISHMIKNLLTCVFLKIFFVPNLATPIPSMAATFNCTRDVGIPLVKDANNNRLADTNPMITASNRPNNTISFPVFFTILYPNIELPIPKLGATIKVDNIINKTKLSSPDIFNSLAVIEAIGPAAFATLLAPMEKATYSEMNTSIPFQTGFRFWFWARGKV